MEKATLTGINYDEFANFIPVVVQIIIFLLYLYPKGYDMTIPVHIKAKRKQYRLTQVELAERAGVGLRFVRELERGKSTVQLNKVNMVLKLFGEELKPAKMEQML